MRARRTLRACVGYVATAILALVLFGTIGCADGNRLDIGGLDLSVYANDASNSFTEDLISCADSPCPLSRLPFLGMSPTPLTVDDLINRLVVSHDWMGQRFEAVLRNADKAVQDIILQMSEAITVVVISGSVRPSYYWSGSSAVFLDPLRMALTQEELDTVDQRSDFRSDYGRDLQFSYLWRYTTSNNEYFYARDIGTRDMEDVANYLMRLLFHELAHANDFFPPTVISAISCDANPSACSRTPGQHRASDRALSRQFGFDSNSVEGDYRLRDTNMRYYSQIRYQGVSANAGARLWSAEDMRWWFGDDAAVHDYAYTTQYEDVAMLTEATLVKFLFDADMDVGCITKPASGEIDGSTPVAWGTRGRIGKPDIKRRAKLVTDLMLPGAIPQSFFDSLEPERTMQDGCGWIDNLDLVCVSGSAKGDGPQKSESMLDIRFDQMDPHGGF